MNNERMLKLADIIEGHENHFDTSNWFVSEAVEQVEIDIQRNGGLTLAEQNQMKMQAATSSEFDCGTRACYAGFACWTWAGEVDPADDFSEAARKLLGLYSDEARLLFNTTAACSARQGAQILRDLVSGTLRFHDLCVIEPEYDPAIAAAHEAERMAFQCHVAEL